MNYCKRILLGVGNEEKKQQNIKCDFGSFGGNSRSSSRSY